MSDDSWSRSEQLQVAAAVAPSLRIGSAAAKTRRVALVNAEGEVVGYTTLDKVQEAVLLTRRLEVEFDDGVRPKEIVCADCGRTARVSPLGPVPRLCQLCLNPPCTDCGRQRRYARSRGSVRCRECEVARVRAEAAARRPQCAECGATLPASAARPYKVARRIASSAPVCLDCCRAKSTKSTVECARCRAPLRKDAVSKRAIKLRGGAPPMCRDCWCLSRRKTHCVRGHELTKENTERAGPRGRRCKLCRRRAKQLEATNQPVCPELAPTPVSGAQSRAGASRR